MLTLQFPFLRPPWVIFINQSGETIPPCAVLRINGWTKTSNTIVYQVGKPNTTFYRRYLVNSQIQVGSTSTSYGFATFLDHGGLVYFGSGTPALHEEWGPTSGEWYLTQHRPGFVVSGTTTETINSKTMLAAKQFPVQIVFGKADTAITKGTSGTVRVYGGAFGTESDTSQTITGCYNKTADIADEDEVTVSWPHGKPLVAPVECA